MMLRADIPQRQTQLKVVVHSRAHIRYSNIIQCSCCCCCCTSRRRCDGNGDCRVQRRLSPKDTGGCALVTGVERTTTTTKTTTKTTTLHLPIIIATIATALILLGLPPEVNSWISTSPSSSSSWLPTTSTTTTTTRTNSRQTRLGKHTDRCVFIDDGNKPFRRTNSWFDDATVATRTQLYQSSNDDRSTTTTTTSSDDKKDEEEILSDVDTRVLRAMLQEENKLNMDNEEELRKLLERGTVKKKAGGTSRRNDSTISDDDDDDDESAYSSKVLQTLTDTKLWKKLSVRANDMLESMSIWVSNKVEQDVKVLAALGIFAWDRVQRDVARALPSSSSAAAAAAQQQIQKQIVWLLTNTTTTTTTILTSNGDDDDATTTTTTTTLNRNVREEMNRPQDEIKSVSRELFAILSGERTKYYSTTKRSSAATTTSTTTTNSPRSQQPQPQRGLRTVAPAGTLYSAERQRRALQQKRKMEQSKMNSVTNLGISNVVDSVWELRQEMKSEMNVPGYKTEPIRNAIAASVSATNNILQSVRERAQLVAAATIRQKDDDVLRLGQEQPGQQPETTETTGGNKIEADIDPMPTDTMLSSQGTTIPMEQNVEVDPPLTMMSASEHRLLNEIQSERIRIMNQLTTCIDEPMDSWLLPDIVDTFESIDFISSTGMQSSITKMILLRDEIQKNHQQEQQPTAITESDGISNNNDDSVQSRLSLDVAINDLLAIRAAIEYLYTCTVEDVSEVIAEEIRYFVLFNKSNNTVGGETTVTIPLILRIDDELVNIQRDDDDTDDDNTVVIERTNVSVMNDNNDVRKKERATTKPIPATNQMKSAVVMPDVLDVIPDAIFIDVVAAETTGTASSDMYNVDEYADIATIGYVAEIVSDGDDDFDGRTFKQLYNVDDDDDDASDQRREQDPPNVLIIVVLRSVDVLLFVVEKTLTVGVPGTITVVSTMVTRIDEMNRFGLGAKGWKELGNVAKAKGRY